MSNPKINVEAIVFDFDGVLAESVGIKGDAFVELYKNETAEIQKKVLDFHEKHGGVTRYEKIRHYEKEFCHREVSESKVMELADCFSDIVEECVVKSSWVVGAKDFLEKFYQERPFYIASGTPDEEMKRIIKKRNMNKYFKAVYGSPKKKGEHLKTIISKNGYNPKHVLMIGDAMSDYNAAQEVKTPFIGRKLPNKTPLFPDDTLIIDDLTELENLIKFLP